MLCKRWIVGKATIDFSLLSQEQITYYKEEYRDDWKNKYHQEINNYVHSTIVISFYYSMCLFIL